MNEQPSRADMASINFRGLVQDCAKEPQIVESFNRAYGASLQVPIDALLDGRWPLEVCEEERLQIGCFIIFVHENIWRRFQRARARMERGLLGR